MNHHSEIDTKMKTYIERFNQLAMGINLDLISMGLYYGKIGLCVYFYELAGLTGEAKYNAVAEKILQHVADHVSENISIDAESGLTGICMAINYLLAKGYVKGDPDEILKSFDDRIMNQLLFNQYIDRNRPPDTINMALSCLAYLTVRLQTPTLDIDEKIIMQNIIIEHINKIDLGVIEKFNEPSSFSITEYFLPFYLHLLQRIFRLNFCNYKIERIIEELSPYISGKYPVNKANCLSLCISMNEINSILGGINGWNQHSEVLQQHLNIDQIIRDFRNKNLFFHNGLCGFYYLLRKNGQSNEYKEFIMNKIAGSDIWNVLLKNEATLKIPVSLYAGLPGIILTYLHILRDSDSNMFFDHLMKQYF